MAYTVHRHRIAANQVCKPKLGRMEKNAASFNRVFLVEDIQLIRESLAAALEEVAGAQVVATAETQVEAIDWLATHADGWTLAVIDLFLREGSGLCVVDWCQGRRPTQRVVVLTNYATAAVRERCLAMGADRVFDKSTELDAFLDFCKDANLP